MRARLALLSLNCLLLTACPTGSDDDDDAGPTGPQIQHTPITEAVEATEIPIDATVTPPEDAEETLPLQVNLNYRPVGGDWAIAAMDTPEGGAESSFAAVIPAEAVVVAGVEYYLQATHGTDIATDPTEAPNDFHAVVVSAAPLNSPDPVRARYDVASDTVEVTWTAPASTAFTGYSVTAELDSGDSIETVCQAGEADSGCSVAADGTWDTDYATWTVTFAADAQAGTSGSAGTDSLHLLLGSWSKEVTPGSPALFGTGELEFFLPSGVAVDGGTVHIAEQSNNRLQSFSAEGDFLGFVGALGGGGLPGDGSSEFNAPQDIAIDAGGSLWVADHTNARVQSFNGTTRQFEDAFGELGEGEGQLRFPVSLSFDGDGLLHVAESVNGRISVFDGTVFVESYAAVEEDFLTPTRVEYLPDLGAMAVSDLDAVHLHPVDEGATAATWDISPGGTAVVSGICAVGHGETMLTLDDPTTTTGSTGHKLVRVDDQGEVVTEIGEWGVGDLQFWRPIDCTTDADGNVWIADGLNHRVVVLGP
ncbi:MAG: hypothetical protein GY898_20300 [Proteobacteria bacterium]|nr:hypothetical protein [Pseudomonadota bacterium]